MTELLQGLLPKINYPSLLEAPTELIQHHLILTEVLERIQAAVILHIWGPRRVTPGRTIGISIDECWQIPQQIIDCLNFTGNCPQLALQPIKVFLGAILDDREVKRTHVNLLGGAGVGAHLVAVWEQQDCVGVARAN